MKCFNCNELIPDDSEFCQYCGSILNKEDEMNEQNENITYDDTFEENEEITFDEVTPEIIQDEIIPEEPAVLPLNEEIPSIVEETKTEEKEPEKTFDGTKTYCKKCGGEINEDKQCTKCGHQYFNIKRHSTAIISILIDLTEDFVRSALVYYIESCGIKFNEV